MSLNPPPSLQPEGPSPFPLGVDLHILRQIVVSHPDKVLDAVRELGDHNEALLAEYVGCPLRSEDDIRRAAGLQGRIQGLQDVLQIFLGKLIEEEEVTANG